MTLAQTAYRIASRCRPFGPTPPLTEAQLTRLAGWQIGSRDKGFATGLNGAASWANAGSGAELLNLMLHARGARTSVSMTHFTGDGVTIFLRNGGGPRQWVTAGQHETLDDLVARIAARG